MRARLTRRRMQRKNTQSLNRETLKGAVREIVDPDALMITHENLTYRCVGFGF